MMTAGINMLDLTVLLVLLVCGYFGYKKGMILTLFKIVRSILSLVLTYWIYPYVSSFLKFRTGLFAKLTESISQFIDLQSLVEEQVKTVQVETISNLQIPDFFKTTLLENNNSEVYNMFNIQGLEDYIVTFLADMVINAVSVVAVFLIVFIIMRLITNALDIVSKLPVIGAFNRIGGIFAGLLQATLILWIFFLGASFFITNPSAAGFYSMLESSVIAKFFYETNILLKMALRFIS